jgi:tetratricopeptide (TPR) repeat protein
VTRPAQNAEQHQGTLDVWLALAVFVLTLVLFLPVCRNEYVNYDDPEYITANRVLRAGLTSSNLAWAFTTTVTSNWHPLTWISLQLDSALYGLDAGGSPRAAGVHFTNALLHALNAGWLCILLASLLGGPWRGAFAATIFAWHPLRVQSVAWASERKDVLCAFFFIATVAAYFRYTKRPTIPRYLCVVAALALGLLSKPMLVTVPLILMLFDHWPLARIKGSPRPLRSRIALWLVLEKLPLFAMAGVSALMTMRAQGATMNSLELLPIGLRVEHAAVACLRYIWMWIWPHRLAAYYPHSYESYPLPWMVVVIGILAAISWVAWQHRRDRPVWLLGWLWYLIMLIPVIGIVQVGGQALADRYTYLPMIGVDMALTWTAAEWARRSTRAWFVAIGLWVLAMVNWLPVTLGQIAMWHDSVQLWSCASRNQPPDYVIINNLGEALLSEGIASAANGSVRMTAIWGAYCEFERAHQLRPQNSEPLINLASAAELLGRNHEAIDWYRKAVELNPYAANARGSLGLALEHQKQYPQAIQEYLSALAIRPELTVLRERMAWLLSLQGECAQAIEHYQRALKENPQNDVSRFNLAANLLECYQPKKAQAELELLKRSGAVPGIERLWARSILQQGLIEAAMLHASAADTQAELCAWIGEAWAARDEHRLAERWLARSLELQPHSAWTQAELAYVRKRQHLDTAMDYRKADQVDAIWRDRMRRRAWDLATRRPPDECLPKVALLLARVVAGDKPERPQDLDTLASALAQSGQFDEAVKCEKEAISRAGVAQQEPMRERLHAYQKHELWVEPSRTKEQWPNLP